MPTYRKNVTDTAQTVLEQAENDGGVLVFEDQKTRIVAEGAQTGTQKTMNAGTNLGRNNGVIMPASDRPGSFLEQTIGRR